MRHSRLQTAIAAVAVLLLLLATFAAGVCHDHRGTSEATCQICHVSHQPADQHLVGARIATLEPIAPVVQPLESIHVRGPAFRITLSRAPPSA
jgi:hypothetical protein